VSPPFDPSGNTALVGATMMFELLCVIAEAHAQRLTIASEQPTIAEN
jgi:guanidinopropionase